MPKAAKTAPNSANAPKAPSETTLNELKVTGTFYFPFAS